MVLGQSVCCIAEGHVICGKFKSKSHVLPIPFTDSHLLTASTSSTCWSLPLLLVLAMIDSVDSIWGICGTISAATALLMFMLSGIVSW
jgi:hypothetical protein